MYKILYNTYDSIRESYYKVYSPIVQNLFAAYLSGTKKVNTTLGTKHLCQVTVKVEQDLSIKSFTRDFLLKYSQDAELKKLLCGSVQELENIFNEIKSDNMKHFQTLSKAKYDKMFQGKTSVQIDDFNAIMHAIFVDALFETRLNKSNFIKWLNFRVCPYCGDTYIMPTTCKDGKVDVKPQIDHFLPKSAYPFFAMSFCNLIPSCHSCNMAPNKHTKDPKGQDKSHRYLMQPYEFKDNAFEFGYDYNGAGIYDGSNFSVLIDYKGDSDLEHGMKTMMATHDRYMKHNVEVADMWQLMMKTVGNYKKYVNNVGIPSEFYDDNLEVLMGFELSDVNSRERVLYKFKKDIASKIVNECKQNKQK